MTIEDRLRKAFRGVSAEGAPERAWVGIEERIEHRTRLRRRARWAAWLAPVVVAAIGVPAFEALAPAGRPAHVVTTTPTPTSTGSPPAGAASTTVTLPVKACPIEYGVVGATPPAMSATATVSGLPAGVPVSVYGGTITLLGPAGWACQGVDAADGGLFLWLNPLGEPLPIYAQGHATATVEAIAASLPSNFGPSLGTACPFIAAARAEATGAGIPCPGPPEGELVTQLDANTVMFEDPPGIAGNGAQSGGDNPAEGLVFRDPATHAAGMVTCVLPAAQKSLCTAVINDFGARYGPPALGARTAEAPACTAQQLSATDDAQNGGGGLHDYFVKLTNISRSPCELSGYPTSLVGIRATGQSVDLKPRRASIALGLGGEVSPVVLAPGEAGLVVIGTDNRCYGLSPFPVIAGTFTSLQIGLPGGGTVIVSGTKVRSYDFTCGALADQLGSPPMPPP